MPAGASGSAGAPRVTTQLIINMLPLTAGCYLKKRQWEIQSCTVRDSQCQDSTHMQQAEENNSLSWQPRNREVQTGLWGDAWASGKISLVALFFTVKMEFRFGLCILSPLQHFYPRYLPGDSCSYLPPSSQMHTLFLYVMWLKHQNIDFS